MATWLPLPGAIPQYCARFCDDALGFAVGWNNWYFYSIVLCLDISAAAIVIDYWPGARHISPAVWISILIVLVLALNIFAVNIYGEAEFVFASIKIITIVGLLILSVVLIFGGGPNHDRLGFRYWKNPGAMKPLAPATGDTGRFLGLLYVIIFAAFTFGGIEMIAASAGEAENPRRNIPKAVKRVVWRIGLFYILGSLAVGMIVSSDDEFLLNAQQSGAPGAARSPWVIGITNAGITVLPSIINTAILTSAASSANAFLYTGSRGLFALAQNGQAPRFFLRCTKRGVPIYCVLATSSISLLTYLTLSVGGSKAFGWFANLITTACLWAWISICVAYLRFRKAQQIQGFDQREVGFTTRFQPYVAWFAGIFFTIILIFNGFTVFLSGRWNVNDFLVAYIGIPIFIVLYGFWKIVKKTRIHPLNEVDLVSDKVEIDQLEGTWEEPVPKNVVQKIWMWLV
ncbi:hypothetical protein H2200_005604 [Cladophialophora chaetospira]|uniref:Amino acid permease/ SLC12A domain-containing protein n=1 Tax=Cladophialophora chaetospira TaxID=386627 RepID=A0AA38XCF8_9EURO|nr:hypothetical protein H2200_005604 [Cladophialophora chaetospira]